MRFLPSIAILLPLLAQGQQNIVPNPSFEEHTDCPYNSAEIEFATPWTNTGWPHCSPDYYHECSPPLVFPPDTFPNLGVPDNGQGTQGARSGVAYGAFYAVSNQELYPNYREYVQVELIEPIYSGVRYEVSFHVSLADKFWYAVGSFGAYFSETPVFRDNGDVLDVEPQIQSPEGIIYDSKDDWMEVRDTFNSRYGGERYLLFGNFRSDSLSNVTFVDSGATNTHNRSYYYIDDVSVIALDSIPNSIVETERLSFSVYPNPATDVIRIVGVEQRRHLRLADLRGREVMTAEESGHDHSLKIGHLPAGLYILEVTAIDGRRATQRVIKMAGP